MKRHIVNWDDLKLFLAVARAGGLSAAAQSTGKSAPTLGRRLLALELSIGQELFFRQSHGYELTTAGETLLQKVLQLETQITSIDQSSDQNKKVLVKISAGSWMTQALMHHTDQLLLDNPMAQLRFIAAEHILDISHRETIIGLRNQRPEQLDLACRRTGKVHFAVYAKNSNVALWAKVLGQTPTAQWLSQNTHQADVIEVSSPRNALDLALAGQSKALLPTFIGEQQTRLQRVSKNIPELSHEQWLVSHQDERFRPEVRQSIDHLYTVCKSLLATGNKKN